jgi:[ribosomal protein S5]-alanine N-acetyltransferase
MIGARVSPITKRNPEVTNDAHASPEPRLRVEPATADHLRALIAGPEQFRDAFGLTVVDGYLDFPEALGHSLNAIVNDGIDPAWGTHLYIHSADRALIGLGGFKGPVVDGTVEIGYGIAPEYRGAGYATEAARVLVERAQAAGVTTVTARTLAEPNASTRVLGRLGFTRTDTIEDPDDGPIWRWELPVRA